MKTIALLTLTAAALAACAGVAPSNLEPVAVASSLTLASPVQYDERYAMAGNTFFYTIEAGSYAARYKDAGGTYHEGSGKCFTVRIESDSLKRDGKPQPTPMSYRCGIFVPVSPAAEPKLYFYHDPGVSQAVFDNAQVQAVDGKGAPVLSPTAGAGAAIGMSIVRALDTAELKNIHFFRDQPKPGQIRKVMQ